MKIQKLLSVIIIGVLFTFTACEKDAHVPPTIVFKTGGIYTSADISIGVNTELTIGIIADKKEDPMKTYNISYAYDGATTTTTKETFALTSAEETHYEKDYVITTRANAGVEKWYFVITDKDGNIAKLTLTITVTV